MRMIAFGLAATVSLMLFGAFGSVGLAARPGLSAGGTVDTRVASMYAVLPDGALVNLTGV